MSQHIPIVSIGIPVYNGEKYLKKTLESLLNQGFQDFEIIISDNGSTDSTPAICCEYEQMDSRVHYHRSEINHGPCWNYNRVFDLSNGKYFKWHACDDLLRSDFLEKCVEVLDTYPDMILAHSYTDVIDERGHQIKDIDLTRIHTDHMRPSVRLRSMLMLGKYLSSAVFGLIRMDILRNAPRQPAYAHGDVIFMCYLAIYGRFYQIPEPLFQYRIHAEQSMQTLPTHMMGLKKRRLFPFSGPLPATDWWDPSKKGKVDFPTWRFYWRMFSFVQRYPMPIAEKLRCHRSVCARLFKRKDFIRLGIDVLLALEVALQGSQVRKSAVIETQAIDDRIIS
jgi:glycosyltransferase involved in cell wall biosynthesis